MFGLGGSMPSMGGVRQGLMHSVVTDPLNNGTFDLGGIQGSGMNPMNALRANANFGTRFQSNPTGMAFSGPAGAY